MTCIHLIGNNNPKKGPEWAQNDVSDSYNCVTEETDDSDIVSR